MNEEKADELVEPGAFGLQVERVAVAMGRTEVAGARGHFGGLVVALVLEPLVGPGVPHNGRLSLSSIQRTPSRW